MATRSIAITVPFRGGEITIGERDRDAEYRVSYRAAGTDAVWPIGHIWHETKGWRSSAICLHRGTKVGAAEALVAQTVWLAEETAAGRIGV